MCFVFHFLSYNLTNSSFFLHAVRWFLWGIVLTFSYGKVNFWLLPNLDNEKLGVIDSFKPLYSIERKKGSGKKSKKKQTEDMKEDASDDSDDKSQEAGEPSTEE